MPLETIEGKPPNGQEKELILVVEDEPSMVRLLTDNLIFEGYRVISAADGEAAIDLVLGSNKPDLILLDLMLPKLDGFAVCRRFRAAGIAAPIIMLTARSLEQDKVTGLKIGADDYLTKPFSIAELLARTEAALRRARRSFIGTYEFGNVRIDFTYLRASRNGVDIELTPREFSLLHYLVENRGRVITRSEMLTQIWGYDGDLHTRTVDTHIANLRQKLEAIPSQPAFIETVHRLGYKFNG